MESKPLIIIGGATGVGKTALSVELAKKINGEIISADSMQVYKGMDIGTAKVTKEETCGIPHYLIDEEEPDFDFNVCEFKRRAEKYIKEIYSHGNIPILVGGTGFYIQSVLYDIDFSEESSPGEYRAGLEKTDAETLYGMLEKKDPESAALIHKNNKKRVIRALEYYHNTGKKISAHNREQKQNKSPYNFAYFILNRERAEIYKRTDRRVDLMIEAGLEAEVRSLLEGGLSENALSMQAIGYKEMVPYVKGEISLDEAVYLIRLDTRHFAKRQITWFKREKEAVWINYEDYPDLNRMLEKMLEILKEKNIVQLS